MGMVVDVGDAGRTPVYYCSLSIRSILLLTLYLCTYRVQFMTIMQYMYVSIKRSTVFSMRSDPWF